MSVAISGGTNPRLENRRAVSVVLGVALVLIGVAVLIGWLAEIRVLTSVVPGLVTMRPLTALCLVTLGALLALNGYRIRRGAGIVLDGVCLVLGLAVVALGAATLIQELTGTQWGYEQLFVLGPDVGTGADPGRPSQATALCLVLLGSGFLAVLADRVDVAQWLGVAGVAVAYLAALAYAFGVGQLDLAGEFTYMAVHTSLALVLAGVGLLHLRPEQGFMRLALAAGPGGAVVRRLLPVVIVAPTLLGLAAQVGVEQGWFDARFALVTVIAMLSVGGAALIWGQAQALEHTDYRRLDAETTLARIRRAEEDRAQAMQRLQVANADLERFAAVAAHDLRAPLTTIRGYAELLGDQADAAGDEPAYDLAQRIERLVHRGTDMIDDLLAYSRSGPESGDLVPTALGPLAREIADEVIEAADRPARIGIEELGWVCGDAPQLRQLFQNLLGNAVKYCPADREPVVVVDALPPREGRTTIRITDNGVGVPDAERERLFAIFQRGSRTTDIAGSGVGLAICERIVGRHGGTIWVEDGPGHGSRFCFTLEAADHS